MLFEEHLLDYTIQTNEDGKLTSAVSHFLKCLKRRQSERGLQIVNCKLNDTENLVNKVDVIKKNIDRFQASEKVASKQG